MPRKGTNPNVLRCDRVAEALPHLGVLVIVARERRGPRFVRHLNPPAAGRVPVLDLVGLNPLRMATIFRSRTSLRHNSIDRTHRTRIDVHPLPHSVGPRRPGLMGTDH